jgi:membrane protease YdiL (CAAX protease family)
VLNVFYSLPHGLWLTLGIIVVVTLLVLLEKWLARRIQKKGDLYPSLLSFCMILSKTVIPLVVLWKVYGLDPGSLGWVKGDFLQAVLKGVALATFMMVFIFIYQKYSYLVFHKPYTSTGGRFLAEGVSGTAMGIAVSAALMNAFGEEIIFRGMLLPALSGCLGIVLAVVVQALIFTVYHFFPLQNSVLLFMMGIFFALGYLWSGSLLTPVLAHLIGNGLPALLFFIRLLRTR